MRIDRWSSPRPDTLKVSVSSVSSTRRLTSVLSSRKRRSRQMAGGHILAFLPGERTVIDNKVHRNSRFGYFLERYRFRCFRCADRIADPQVCNTGNCYDRTDCRGGYFYLIQTVKFVQLADLDALLFVRIMVVYEYCLLIDGDRTAVYLLRRYVRHTHYSRSY